MTQYIINGRCAQHDECHCFVTLHVEADYEAMAYKKFVELVTKNDLNLYALDVDAYDLSVSSVHKPFWKGHNYVVFSGHWSEDFSQNLFANFVPCHDGEEIGHDGVSAFVEVFR